MLRDEAITKRPNLVETAIDEEIIVMRLDNGELYSLAGTAAAAWRLIDGKRDRAALVAALTEEYSAPDGRIAADIGDCLWQWQESGLIGG